MGRNKDVIREAMLIGLCVVAASIGPGVLINAKFSMQFVIGGFIYSLVSMVISLIIYKAWEMLSNTSINSSGKYSVGFLLGYVPFFSIIFYHYKDIPGNVFQIFYGDGLLSLLPIVGLLLLAILVIYLRGQKLVSAIVQSGFFYLLPLFVVIKLMPLIPNSEGKVLFGNVAIVYFVLKLVLYWRWKNEI